MAALPEVAVEEVERSAAPDEAAAALDRLRGVHPDLEDRLPDDAAWRRLVAVVAASRSLTELLATDAQAITAVADPHQPVGGAAASGDLRAWFRREVLRIAALDLAGEADLAATTAALSDAARQVLAVVHAEVAAEVLGADHRLVIVGMGKLSGDELNYASDVDILLVGDGDPRRLERAGRTVLERAGSCFRVDADLRPEGRDGALVRSVAAYEAYWQRWAQPWERQALLRAEPVVGDEELAAAWAEAAAGFVWGRPLSPEELRSLRALKVRAEDEVRKRGLGDREVKRGPGGIRDVEFAAQLLQLVHGPVDQSLRRPGTVASLGALVAGGYVDAADAEALVGSYQLLRRVEHGIQLRDGRQTHTLPADRAERRHLARVLGYRGDPSGGATERFDRDLRTQRATVRAVHERLWFRPLLATLSGAGTLGPDRAADRLAAFGFTDVERTRQAVVELTRGLTRSSRMMQQLLPLLLDWLSASPDPDLGLLGLRRLATGETRTVRLAAAFRDSPEVARRLALLLGTSRRLGDVLLANPDLVERLADEHRLRTRSRPELVDSATSAIEWRSDVPDRQRALQRWQHRHLLGVAARDVLDLAGVEQVGADLSALAEAALEAALATLQPQVPFAVLALGRLGGTELGYASDLDLVFAYDGADQAAADEADRVATELVRFVDGGTPARRIWAVDATLRPEGRSGPLARSLEGWRSYLDRWASTWERQAYLRLRTVAGDAALGASLAAAVADAIWARPFTEADTREVRRMKARIEQERIGRGEDPTFHLKLGPGSLSDVEFTVQLLQLQHRVPEPSTIVALHALRAAGHLDEADADVLEAAYRFCEETRNRSFLVAGPGDSLPMRPEQVTPLARSLGHTVPGLREEYRRRTRRARRVVERVFYGRA
ncbi:MAG: bifunctional [glutamine synthetase] adenylyltransferase/[glutamine synthetase]-adenylyl-L-tyrosine phosphorylase [Acidimicrobiia bacterium]